jgi:hypothetical protein
VAKTVIRKSLGFTPGPWSVKGADWARPTSITDRNKTVKEDMNLLAAIKGIPDTASFISGRIIHQGDALR